MGFVRFLSQRNPVKSCSAVAHLPAGLVSPADYVCALVSELPDFMCPASPQSQISNPHRRAP